MSKGMGSEEGLKWVASSNTILGHVLALIRRKRGLTQVQLAHTLGLAGSTWSRIEKGESSLTVEQLRAAAEALGISAATLLGLAAQGEEALRRYGAIIAPSINRGAARLSGFGKAVENLLPAGALPLIGTALGAALGKVLGSALEKALTTDTRAPSSDTKEE